jgi:PIN domain nuclease of toxin-antitoxin system
MSGAALLLDSHVWYWTVLAEAAIGPRTKAMLIENASHHALAVSEISFWELANKAAKGKIELRPDPSEWLDRAARAPGIGVVELNREILVRATMLAWSHRDPADRMLVATALFYDLQLLTVDRVILDYAQTNPLLRVFDASN